MGSLAKKKDTHVNLTVELNKNFAISSKRVLVNFNTELRTILIKLKLSLKETFSKIVLASEFIFFSLEISLITHLFSTAVKSSQKLLFER